jgi:hypothetical protein
MPGTIAVRYRMGLQKQDTESLAAGGLMSSIRRLIALLAVAVAIVLAFDSAEAGRRGHVAHHSQIKVWHGNRVVGWTHTGHWPRHAIHVSGRGWHGSPQHWNSSWNSTWNSKWGWSRGQGYPHRWWSWNSRKHPHFASRGHRRHASHNWGHGSQGSRFGHEPRRQGVWHATPAFGSTAARGGPVRQGEWHAD